MMYPMNTCSIVLYWDQSFKYWCTIIYRYKLKLMNRIHNADQAIKTIDWTGKLFDNFSIDLIYGMPSSDLSAGKKI